MTAAGALSLAPLALAGCFSYGDVTCQTKVQADLARFANDPFCEAILIYQSSLESLDGLQGADKNISALFNRSLVDVSAIDNAREAYILDSAVEVVAATASSFTIRTSPMRSAHLGLRAPIPNELDEPAENFPEPLNDISLGTTVSTGPESLSFYCVESGCRAQIHVSAASFDAAEITVSDVVVVQLGIWGPELTSWEFLQGFGVPEQTIRLSAPQDVELIRRWRVWLDANGFTGSLAVCVAGQPCDEVLAE